MSGRKIAGVALAIVLTSSAAGVAQPEAPPPAGETAPPPPPPPPPPLPPLREGALPIRDSSVGYINPAAPADQVWLRTDLGYNFRTPNRAEFFYAKGLPLTERSVDFQEQTLYVEKMIGPCWSLFAESGVRFLNPDRNANAYGLGDTNLGFKWAFYTDESSIFTLQVRTYLPTAAASRGLGTGHVSVEPGLLWFVRLWEDLGLAGELRYWDPIDGTDFAGGVLRYGLGLRYDAWHDDDWRVAPIFEAVGWSVLDGRESLLQPDGRTLVRDVSGTTVVNLKLGVRVDVGRAGMYVGYGRSVTGARWYEDIVRVEFRWLY
jgi:hypothetical protein